MEIYTIVWAETRAYPSESIDISVGLFILFLSAIRVDRRVVILRHVYFFCILIIIHHVYRGRACVSVSKTFFID